MSSLRRPPRLAPGARVALVAPAGPLRGDADVERAVANVRGFGWEPVVGAHVLARHGYLAGTDAERLADLNGALRDDRVDAVWCLRGGYGTMRLLGGVDFDALRRRPRPVIGYSDVTALHVAVGLRAGVTSFHGPTARATLPEFSRASLDRAVAQGADPCGQAPGARTLRGGVARGRLVGGNLAILAALCGTPYAPDTTGAILVVEDVNEPVYRIDRLLVQLRLAGLLSGVAGVAFGAFTEVPTDAPEEAQGSRTVGDLLAEVARVLDVPCVAGVPVGHIDEQWTLPLGAEAELDADALRLSVVG